LLHLIRVLAQAWCLWPDTILENENDNYWNYTGDSDSCLVFL
jgi:hypothetical protein